MTTLLLIIGGIVLGILLAHSDEDHTAEPPIVYIVQRRSRPSGCLLIGTFLLGVLVALVLQAQAASATP